MKKIMLRVKYLFILLLLPLLANAAEKNNGYPQIKLGVLSQFHVMNHQSVRPNLDDGIGRHARVWERQVYLRRMRILIGGNISEHTSFFFETDAPNIGYVNQSGEKNIRLSIFVQDAQIQHVFSKKIGFIAGLQLVGITRNGLQSAASLMALDYGSYQFLVSGPLDNLAGRDLGINLRGFIFDHRLEYRTGFFSGKNSDRTSSYRFTTRLNYNFIDREFGFFYTGTTLGTGKFLSVGGGIDIQNNYYGIAIDSFLDYPLFPFGSLTASTSYTYVNSRAAREGHYDFTADLPRQNIFFVETGMFIPSFQVQPYIKYERNDVRQNNTTVENKLRSGERIGFGLNYYVSAHTMSIKLLYEQITGHYPLLDSPYYEQIKKNQIVIQIQYFSF
jgi:hypothetical protein